MTATRLAFGSLFRISCHDVRLPSQRLAKAAITLEISCYEVQRSRLRMNTSELVIKYDLPAKRHAQFSSRWLLALHNEIPRTEKNIYQSSPNMLLTSFCHLQKEYYETSHDSVLMPLLFTSESVHGSSRWVTSKILRWFSEHLVNPLCAQWCPIKAGRISGHTKRCHWRLYLTPSPA